MYNGTTSNRNNMNLRNTLRKLWEQHVLWTRSFIISTAHDIPDISYVTERLLRNPKDFAVIFNNFYNKTVADKFEQLLTNHFLIAADLVNYAKKGDAQGAKEAQEKWYANADDIAEFLSSINPCWNQNKWKAILYEHLRMTEDEAVKRLNKQYKTDIMLYDEIENQALNMADYMAEGFRRQCFY